jgi:peptidoglycan/xylan/chitin deacetylase (PgdA/CDA1 family)
MIARRTECGHQVNETPQARHSTAALQAGDHKPLVAALRRTLAGLYYYATYSGRAWYQRRLAAAGRAPIAVLAFHRIADDRANRWTTNTRDFVGVVRWLQRRFELISLTELQRRVRSGHSSRPGVCITFDDGYADNCDVALPLLAKEQIPCTYFVTTESVLEGKPFVHDTEMGNHHMIPNTIEQLRRWCRAGIEIGAHTRTHADLGETADRQRLMDEIVTSRNELESALGHKVRHFAFPFGGPDNLTCEAFEMAEAAGFESACSAYGGWNYPGDNPFHIRRRCVDGPPNRAKNWAVIDPIRERSLPSFVYAGQRKPVPKLGAAGAAAGNSPVPSNLGAPTKSHASAEK